MPVCGSTVIFKLSSGNQFRASATVDCCVNDQTGNLRRSSTVLKKHNMREAFKQLKCFVCAGRNDHNATICLDLLL